ncbi:MULTISPECIES: hypothetical protein [unclassified Novosphingobium]|uniref:hypothetical protein n=1 Tax=unclassified Novosphingobium TaxID=2644732 RepID=UPI00146CBBC0|nr:MULTISPECIES: hypothetical protein [unclassified Novosphingobium]NMN87270.1 hypothetical protein [Novosphingobium sp. SG916]
MVPNSSDLSMQPSGQGAICAKPDRRGLPWQLFLVQARQNAPVAEKTLLEPRMEWELHRAVQARPDANARWRFRPPRSMR